MVQWPSSKMVPSIESKCTGQQQMWVFNQSRHRMFNPTVAVETCFSSTAFVLFRGHRCCDHFNQVAAISPLAHLLEIRCLSRQIIAINWWYYFCLMRQKFFGPSVGSQQVPPQQSNAATGSIGQPHYVASPSVLSRFGFDKTNRRRRLMCVH